VLLLVLSLFYLLQDPDVVIVAVDSLEDYRAYVNLVIEPKTALVKNGVLGQYCFDKVLLQEIMILIGHYHIFCFETNAVVFTRVDHFSGIIVDLHRQGLVNVEDLVVLL